MSWHEQAACRGRQDIDWFPSTEATNTKWYRDNLAAARDVCASCPVRDACLAEALEQGCLQYGIWAGTTARQRLAIPHKRRVVAECGTDSGYFSHRRRNEDPCTQCRLAHNEANRGRDRRQHDRKATDVVA